MRFDGLLRAHAFMKVERPPDIWEADTEDVRFVPLLGEMIAAGLSKGAPLEELTLNVSNVVVERDPDDDPSPPSAGEYVAVTVSGNADFGPDSTWPARPGTAVSDLLVRLKERLATAGARYAYTRRLPQAGSLTVFLPRLRTN